MGDPSLKGVMIGAGFFARFQAEAWKRIERVEIVAVADPLPGRAEAFAAEYGIPRSYTDAAAMLQAGERGLRRHRHAARIAPGTHRSRRAALPRGDLPKADGAHHGRVPGHGGTLRAPRRAAVDSRKLALAALVSRGEASDRRKAAWAVSFISASVCGPATGADPRRTCSSPISARCRGCCSTRRRFTFWTRFAFWAGIWNRSSARRIESIPRFKARTMPWCRSRFRAARRG